MNFGPLCVLCSICRLVCVFVFCADYVLHEVWFDVVDGFYMSIVSCDEWSACLSNVEFVAIPVIVANSTPQDTINIQKSTNTHTSKQT